MERGGDVEVFIFALIISSFLFFAGLVIGLNFGEQKISEFEQKLKESTEEVVSLNLILSMSEALNRSASCDLLRGVASRLGDVAEELGSKVTRMELEGKIMTEEYTRMKAEYMKFLINDMMVLSKVKHQCDANYTIIIYFYSNKYCDNCKEQGYVLDYYKLLHKDSLLIFAIDSDINVTLVNALVNAYGVTEYPTIVVDGKKYEGFLSKEEFGEVLCESSKICS